MTVKQLAQRMGVDVKELDFELADTCKKCRKMGGKVEPCNRVCIVSVKLSETEK
jgi:hypothetical protein